MPTQDLEEMRATARLPNLDIEIVHRRAPDASAEQLTVSLRAVPSFAAFADHIEAANPFLFWARMMELAWQPWLQAFAPRLPGAKPER
ncbi:MAG TPA: hypothetical protein VLV50_13180 [Stellaceae bacterium]|nr:hypothetical protein [Stellaceae bacterium]